MTSSTKLSVMPNIGAILAKNLIQVGIESPEQLKSLGAEQAFIRLRVVEPDACVNKLYAIEGAIEGIRWHNLDPMRKQELKEFFAALSRA